MRDLEYYNQLDKRCKEYKDWKAAGCIVEEVEDVEVKEIKEELVDIYAENKKLQAELDKEVEDFEDEDEDEDEDNIWNDNLDEDDILTEKESEFLKKIETSMHKPVGPYPTLYELRERKRLLEKMESK